MDRSSCQKRCATATLAVAIFFPQRVPLRLDSHAYSVGVLTKILVASGSVASYATAAKVLEVVGELSISSRQMNKLTDKIGGELQAIQDEKTQAYRNQPLPRKPKEVTPTPQLACVEVDGGRMQTRTAGQGSGVHAAHWRETKNAGFIPYENDFAHHGPASGVTAMLRRFQADEEPAAGAGSRNVRC